MGSFFNIYTGNNHAMRTGKMVQLILLRETHWARYSVSQNGCNPLIRTGKTGQENIAFNVLPCATGSIKQHQNS